MQVDFLEIMESLFHIHNIEMTLIRLEDLPAETSDSTDAGFQISPDFRSNPEGAETQLYLHPAHRDHAELRAIYRNAGHAAGIPV